MAPSSKPHSQTKGTQKKSSGSSTRTTTVKLDGPSSSVPLNPKRINPLTAFSNLTQSTTLPSSRGSSNSNLPPKSQKGKGKAKQRINVSPVDNIDDSLWIDKYEPTTEGELAVHVKKVEDVRRWLSEAFDGGQAGKLQKYRRILAMTGPAGTGKTSTIRVLAREMGFEILEWRNGIGETISAPFVEAGSSSQINGPELDLGYEGLFTKFEAFLTRASTCHDIFSGSSSTSKNPAKKRVILLEDLPNILYQKTQTQFHEALNSLVISPPSNPPVPVVIIISDAGLRGEASDERRAEGGGWGKGQAQAMDIRTVLPKSLLGGPYVTEIQFNPIAPTLLKKALQAMLGTHFSSSFSTSSMAPSKEVLDIIVESAHGDIRSAIMALQFACILEIPGQKKKTNQARSTIILEAVTRREQSLALFHLLGKVMYNKRKDDPPNPSASAKDLQKERAIDALLKGTTQLPPHLRRHDRRMSRVDIDALYADSPIDSSLFSLYIHQNYTQFCNEIEETEGVADWLSWVDSSGGDAWYLANPHQFHLLALGTLHSLPSPVPRRSQKYFKPEFFSFLQKEKDAWDSVRTTKDWITENEAKETGDSGWRAGGWSNNDVVLELSSILKASDAESRRHQSSQPQQQTFKPPPIHRLFSRMEFTRATGNGIRSQQLNEGDLGLDQEFESLVNGDRHLNHTSPQSIKNADEDQGGWLGSDDIEDFE